MSEWTWPKLLKFLKGAKIDKIKEIEDNGKNFKFTIEGTKIDMPTKQEKGFNETQKKELIEIINSVVDPIKQDIAELKRDVTELKKDVAAIKNCPTIKKELAQ